MLHLRGVDEKVTTFRTDEGTWFAKIAISGPILGLAPAPGYTLCCYVSPVGSYFKGNQLTPIKLKLETGFSRAAPGGSGGVKAIGNKLSSLPVTEVSLEPPVEELESALDKELQMAREADEQREKEAKAQSQKSADPSGVNDEEAEVPAVDSEGQASLF